MLFIFVAFLLSSNIVYAIEDSSRADYSIPYFQPQYIKLDYSEHTSIDKAYELANTSMKVGEEIKQLKPKDIKEIAAIGANFCHDLGECDLKLWFKLGANGSIGIAGASSEAGIEVTFHCGKK